MTREQILTLLYDMALASGGETHVRPLITKTLQRLLYHTSFPCGLYLVEAEAPRASVGARMQQVAMAVGCHQLLPAIDKEFALPVALVEGASALLADASLLAPLPQVGFTVQSLLRLRVSPHEMFLLLSPRPPEQGAFLATIFDPVLRNFGKHLQICRANERATQALQEENHLRQEAEALLRQERDLFVAGPVVAFRWSGDEAWRVLYVSDNVQEQFGYSPRQLLEGALSFRELIHPEDRQQVAELVERYSSSGREYYEGEYRIADGHGAWRWVYDITFPQRNTDGSFRSLTGYLIDITERKQAELEQRLLATAFDTHEAIAITDSGNTIVRVNRAFSEITGYSAAEVVGRKPDILSSGRHEPEFYRQMWQQLGQSGHWEGEIINRRKDGELFPEWLSITAVDDERGRVSNYIAHFTDISAIKRQQAQIERTVAEEQVLSGLLRLALAETGKREFLNAALSMVLTGVPWLSLLPQGAIFLVDSESSDELVMAAEYQLGSELLSHCKRVPFGHCLCGKSAQQRRVIATNHLDSDHDVHFEGMADHGHYTLPIMNRDELLGVFNVYVPAGHNCVEEEQAFLRRVTDVLSLGISKRFAQQELMAAKEQAEQASRAKSDFLSSMSHELRTPMNAILGFAQILEYDDTLQEEQLDSVQEILKAGNHLLELINEVLDLAKIEAGRIDLSLEPVVVDELVEECFSLVEPLAAKHAIVLDHGPLNGAVVRADRVRLKQVLLNLLSNAIKYNREGGRVALGLNLQPVSMLRLQVRDTGQGIPGERLGELFQPFNRLAAEQSTVEGTGIGLTITRRIVELMGGAIGVESTLGVGSTFWIDLPLESLPGQLAVTGARDGQTAAATQQVEQRCVLYIEDNPVNLKLVSQLLGRLPHIHLISAHTPQLGIELAMAHHPELILLDINMPGMDGYQVLHVLRGHATLKKIPVLAVTANAMPRDIERGLEAGFAEYITKPINMRSFIDTVTHWLEESRERP